MIFRQAECAFRTTDMSIGISLSFSIRNSRQRSTCLVAADHDDVDPDPYLRSASGAIRVQPNFRTRLHSCAVPIDAVTIISKESLLHEAKRSAMLFSSAGCVCIEEENMCIDRFEPMQMLRQLADSLQPGCIKAFAVGNRVPSTTHLREIVT